VAEIALEAGFSAGTGDVLSSLGKGITISEEVAIIGASAVTEQLTEMKLGLRDHFDLRSVLEQMATQAITSEIAPAINSNQASSGVNANSNTVIMLQGQEMSAEDVVINTVVSGVVQEVFEGQMSAQAIENLAANAVGTEVGDAVGSEIESPQIQPQAQANTPQSMPQQNVFERIIGDIETEITSAVDDIKELFDPKLVAPTAQKPAPSIAKKMSRQGIFAQRVNSENDDGIDLTLNPSYDKLNPAQLGKGLNLSDGTVSGSGVSRVPTSSASQGGVNNFGLSQATTSVIGGVLDQIIPGGGLDFEVMATTTPQQQLQYAETGLITLATDGLGEFAGPVLAKGGVSALRWVGLWSAKAPEFLNPNDIKFTQETVSYLKQRPGIPSYSLDDIISSMQSEGWVGDPIDVVKMPNGEYVSVDNTRVLAAREAGIDVRANIRDYNERLPEEMAPRFRNRYVGGARPETWGEAAENRLSNQGFDFVNVNPEGTFIEPKITYNLNLFKLNL
ncbi:MAG: hypothetical protein SFW07_02675, partial [Gammaproteobacteria bacterium]|nr:hypothetical protein [Gammaproteobacteria bacterium]